MPSWKHHRKILMGNTSSRVNTEVKQQRAEIILGWEIGRELQVLLTKIAEHVS